MDEFLTPAELAKRWKIKKQTIYIRLHEGRNIPRYVKTGNFVRFPIREVLKFEQEHMRTPD